jgi:predicted DNA-binding WGR domain protein
MVRLECKDGAHYKFWEAEVKASSLIVHFGRIGTEGQVKAKKLPSPAAAQAELEKLIREKLAKGYARKGGKASAAKAAKAAKPAKQSPKAAALLSLAALLAPTHAPTERRVALALNDPDAYAKKYADDLEERNAEDDPVDPWLALVTAVTHDDVRLARPIDWKESAEEIVAALGAIITAQRRLRKDEAYDANKLLAFYDEDAHLRTKTEVFLALCGGALSAHRLALVELDLASDSFEVTVIPWKDVPLAKSLAKKAGGDVIMHGPKTPLAKALPSPAAATARVSAKVDKRRVSSIVGTHRLQQLPGLLRWKDGKPGQTFVVDCRAWPPKDLRLASGKCSVALHENGARILHNFHYPMNDDDEFARRPVGTLRVERPGKPAADILALLPDNFDIETAWWFGDLAVLFPDEPTVTGTKARRPLVWNGKTLAPAKGLADVKPSRLRPGAARTAAGVDVLLWDGSGYVAKGDQFVKTFQLAPALADEPFFVGAPAQGRDGFFYLHKSPGKKGSWGTTALRHATKGKCVECARFDRESLGPLVGAHDGRVVFALNRSEEPKTPPLVVFHPDSNELTMVPAALLGIRKDDQAEVYGVSAPAKGEPFLWALIDYELRRVPWAAVLALPRVAATT